VKRLMRGALALLFAAGVANAQFEGIAEMKISTTGAGKEQMTMNGTGKTYISKVGWRSEIEMSNPEMSKMTGGKPFRMVMFGKLAEPDIAYSVNDTMKTYAVINTKEMRDLAGKIEKQEKKFTVKRLGKGSVAGLSCENVRVTEDKGAQEIDGPLDRGVARRDVGHEPDPALVPHAPERCIDPRHAPTPPRTQVAGSPIRRPCRRGPTG